MLRTTGLVAVVAAVLACPSAAFAHKLDVTATVGPPHPDRVRVTAIYESDDPAADAKVTLTDAAGNETARGTADANGACLLPRPPAGTYTVTADDGAGHRESIALTVPASEAETAAAASAKRNRGLMTVTGLAAIAGLTFAARRVARREKSPAPREQSPV